VWNSWAEESRIYFQQFEKITTYEDHEDYVVEIFEFCTNFLKLVENKYLWNVTITEKCHLLPAAHFICSVQYEATFSTVTERTEADILCAVTCWMLNVTHNKHIPLHIHFVTPYDTSVLRPALLYIYIHICMYVNLLTGKSSASADRNRYQVKTVEECLSSWTVRMLRLGG
jgi:hypothetical protein